MQLIVAVDSLADTGEPQAYALTVAEELAQLGHAVTLFARSLGATADAARDRGLNVTADEQELPEHVDGVVGALEHSLAFELAARYPKAAYVRVVRAADDVDLPAPPVAFATLTLQAGAAADIAAVIGRRSTREGPQDEQARQLLDQAQAISAQLAAMRADLEQTRATVAEAATQMHAIAASEQFKLRDVLLSPAQMLRRLRGKRP